MRNHKRSISVILILLLVAMVTAISALSGQIQKTSPLSKEQQKAEFESQFPVADYVAPESTDTKEHTKRQARSRRLYTPALTVHEDAAITANTTSLLAMLPALPITQSNAIVIGEVTDAQAFLSNDKTNVYSEFTVRLNEVLKGDSYPSLNPHNSIVVGRPGGRIRFPSGKVNLVFTVGEGMPRVNHKYVLFLTYDNQEQDFDILTGYEIRGNHIALLDNLGADHPIAAYDGVDTTKFFKDLRTAISNSSQASPQ